MVKQETRESGTESHKTRSLRDALDDIPTDDEQMEILIGLGDSNVSDEATVVVGGAILEFVLRDAIARHFRKDVNQKEISKLFKVESNGPLNDFSSKIKLAYALGIWKEKTREDLDKIREIRNYFAHTLDL
jgi:hypothetical protein